jgi:uroporphyrinogen-III synthase
VRPPVIVTRPALAGERLQRRLQAAGYDVQWWPAFEFGPAPDEANARATLAKLADFDLAVFVSPQAVQAARMLMASTWPGSTDLGAVGSATADALREAFQPDANRVIEPRSEASGSEALWSEWLLRGRPGRHVLIVRAQHGREWLAERFADSGAAVEELAVYTRSEAALGASALAWLRRAMVADVAPATVVSSSEAVDAVERQLSGVAGAVTWIKQGVALATHARIRDRLLDAGYGQVELTPADDDAIVARLESLQHPRSAEP